MPTYTRKVVDFHNELEALSGACSRTCRVVVNAKANPDGASEAEMKKLEKKAAALRKGLTMLNARLLEIGEKRPV